MPVVASQAGQVSVMLADTVMVGAVGETELAAVAFAGNLSMPILYSGGMAMCITPLVGKRFGALRHDSIAFCLKQTKIFSYIVGLTQVAVSLLLWMLMPYMGQPADVVEMAQAYMPILLASFLPAQMFIGYKQFVEGLHNTQVPMRISLIGNALNIVLNYIFIQQWGYIGAAWATLVARLFMWLTIDIIVRKGQLCRPYFSQLPAVKLKFRAVKKMLLYGLPIGGQMVVECIAFSLGGIMMGWIGTAELAAHQVVMTLTCLTFMMAGGLSSAVTIKVSVSRGQRDAQAVGRYTKASILAVTLFMLTTSVILITGRNIIPACFSDSVAVIQAAATLMVIGGMFQLFDGLQVVALGALRGMGDMTFPALVSGVAYTATCLPVGYIVAFVFEIGAAGIWIGYLAGLILAASMLLLRVRRNLKQLNFSL